MHKQSENDEQATADVTSRSSRNDVAYLARKSPPNRAPRGRSGHRDSKHTKVASLAVDLASSSLWSENILPRVVDTRESDSALAPTIQQGTSALPTGSVVEHSDLEPPPEYSPYQDRELSPESYRSDIETMRHPLRQPEMTEGTRSVHGFRESDYQHGADAPLLEHSSYKTANTRHRWTPEDTDNRRRGPYSKHRLVVAIIFLLFMTGALALYLRFRIHDPKPMRVLPLISTNSTHIYHSPAEDISGRFELHDRLELSTATGDINIQIDPQPNDDYNNASSLILSSSTGRITLAISPEWLSRKEKTFPTIHTSIKSVTGTIHATILLGSGGSATIFSVSGSQDLRVYAYRASTEDSISHLSTTSTIGDQVVALANFGGWDTTIDNLQAVHRSLGTAHIDLQYSNHWRGRVHAKATSIGRVEVQGDEGLVFDQQSEHEVIAHKGKGDHLKEVDVTTEGTGGIEFKSWYTW